MQQPASSAPPTAPPAPAARSASVMAWLQMFIAVIQAALIAGFGWLLKDRLDIALRERQTAVQERQATVQALDRMKELLKVAGSGKPDDSARWDAIRQLAMFGSDAIYPLFVMAATPGDHEATAFLDGLRLLAVRHRDEVCTVLLDARRVPNAIDRIREAEVGSFTEELKCQPGPRPR